MNTPGFLNNGIDFEQLIAYYLSNNCYIEITDQAEINLAIELMKHVINNSFGYDSGFSSTIHGRFQMIFNSTLEELYIEKAGLDKKSNATWLLTGTYEGGTDFQSSNGKQIEAKVYRDLESMKNYAEAGSTDYRVFHGADYVLCYLIDSYELNHWWWLKKDNGSYDIYVEPDLVSITKECLPASIPVCYCKIRDNKLIIGKNTFCT